jgi:mannosyl-3-phosphoglycerate phosphatase family protein
MLAPRVAIFTASRLIASANSAHPAAEALQEIDRQKIPFVLATHDTRAEIEPLRRKIGHAHPFITEGGGGLFIPDGYFNLRLEGAKRVARFLSVSFGRSYQDVTAAVEEIAKQAGADVVRYAEMSARDIAGNTGMTVRDAERSRDREFSERFFFAGNAGSSARSFEKIAQERNWQARRGEPFWELSSGNDEGKAVRYLMRLYRQVLRSHIRSVAIGSSLEDASLLGASDQALALPLSGSHFDERLLEKLPNAVKTNVPGSQGWNQTVLSVLSDV